MADSSEGRGSTTAQLKADIDSGRTGDKVASPDPGLSPLGTDDEAAGVPASPDVIAQVREMEKARPVVTEEERRSPNLTWLIFGAVLCVAVVAMLVLIR